MIQNHLLNSCIAGAEVLAVSVAEEIQTQQAWIGYLNKFEFFVGQTHSFVLD